VVKALLAGADVVMCVSTLIQRGPEHLAKMLSDAQRIIEEKGWKSVESMKGLISHQHDLHRGAFERANYLQSVTTFKGA
jgi:dihydroorotate dehydrogenase (fumarate)